MKKFAQWTMALLVGALTVGCGAVDTLHKKVAQGAPYELLVVCEQDIWLSPLADSLQVALKAPVPYLNQTEPHFDVLRIRPQDFTDMLAEHRNVLQITTDKSLTETRAYVEYDRTAAPQVVVTLQGPNVESLTAYVTEHRSELADMFEIAERNRDVAQATKYGNLAVEQAVKERFGMEIHVPKGFLLANAQEDFLWARNEYPSASQGFTVYSYPYEGSRSLTAEALTKARNRFVSRIPGPSDGSYMTTSPAFEPDLRVFRRNGRLWCELRGFWDVEGDFMGGPFVSYTTVDTATNRVVTYDAYVYSPRLNKRNYVRAMEHLFYTLSFPTAE